MHPWNLLQTSLSLQWHKSLHRYPYVPVGQGVEQLNPTHPKHSVKEIWINQWMDRDQSIPFDNIIQNWYNHTYNKGTHCLQNKIYVPLFLLNKYQAKATEADFLWKAAFKTSMHIGKYVIKRTVILCLNLIIFRRAI